MTKLPLEVERFVSEGHNGLAVAEWLMEMVCESCGHSERDNDNVFEWCNWCGHIGMSTRAEQLSKFGYHPEPR